MKKLISTIYATSLIALTNAQGLNSPIVPPSGSGSSSGVGNTLKNMVLAFKDIATGVYSSLFIVALIMFFAGIIMLMRPGADPTEKSKGFKYLGFGVVALFVMVGIWGLVGFLSANLGIGVGGDIPTPGVPVNIRTY